MNIFKLFFVFFSTTLFSQSSMLGEFVVPLDRSVEKPENYREDSKALLKVPKDSKGSIHLPYPIIFIHGLNSNSETWSSTTDSMEMELGLTFGGRFDFCLNYDGDNSRANLNFWPTSGADLAMFAGTWVKGDYYYVNFDVGQDGSVPPGWGVDVESNQQAITKQGKALSIAIRKVLELTQRDRVILFGHSMGGLASRQYLQNTEFWQIDGHHHVAKLITTGTPHGGSNASAPSIVAALAGIDLKSDAVRDLRTSYSQTGYPGVFLFGGEENENVIDDFWSGNFHNLDVNCNGQEGDLIVGLNQKTLPQDVDYACVIGLCDGCALGEELPGDGVVNASKADLNTYYPNVTKNIFYYQASSFTEIHTVLPGLFSLNMRALDEPAKPTLAYAVDVNKIYMGFITRPSVNQPFYPIDVDLFSFYLPFSSTVTVVIDNISVQNLSVQILDSTQHVVSNTYHSQGSQSLSFYSQLGSGHYFLKLFGKSSTENSIHPYVFTLTSFPSTSFSDVEENNLIEIFPNPTNQVLKINGAVGSTLELFHISGQLIKKIFLLDLIEEIDLSDVAPGAYVVKIVTNHETVIKKIIKN